MLERNDTIYTIHEADISDRSVYNLFFKIESCIIYVLDEMDRFVGVITSKKFIGGGANKY